MRALICDDYEGGIESLRVGDLPDPEPGPGTVLVEVEAAAVNFADTLMVKGEYQVKPDPPFAPGYELAGTVVVANQAPGLSPGDRVCGFTFHGALAEKAVVQAGNAAPIPDSIGAGVACTLPGGYGTSYHALVDRGRLEEGETLLVLGASGGVGMAAVQIGHALGANVIAAVSSEEKAEAARVSGADEVIRYDRTPIRQGIDEASDGRGVDVVYDPVGGEVTEQALRSLNWGGRLLVIGFAAGDIPRIPLNLPLLKGNSVVGVFWGRFTQEEPERHKENFATIIQWAAEGRIEPLIQREFDLEHGADAMQWVADRKAIGRVVVTP
jgi:NADPH2:quinone reductase